MQSQQKKIQSLGLVVGGVLALLFSTGLSLCSLAGGRGSERTKLEEKINPNNACAASLVRLPGIGVGRAEAIIAYRRDCTLTDANQPAFRDCKDLVKVPGVGPKTVENMSRWLRFN